MCVRDKAMCRVGQVVLIDGVAAVVVPYAANRVGLVIYPPTAAVVFVTDSQVATAANGIPMQSTSAPVNIEGLGAASQWNGIAVGASLRVAYLEYVMIPEISGG